MNRIGVDVDGVLANFNDVFLRTIIQITGEDLFPQEVVYSCWQWPQAYGYTNGKHLNKVWDSIHASETFWELLPALEGATEAIVQLYGRVLKGDDVYFITNRTSTSKTSAKHQTERWLMQQTVGYLDIWANFYPTVITTDNKGDAAKLLNLTHYIDDMWENCVNVEVATDETEVYLKDAPYNQGVEDNWIQRVGGVMDMIKELD